MQKDLIDQRVLVIFAAPNPNEHFFLNNDNWSLLTQAEFTYLWLKDPYLEYVVAGTKPKEERLRMCNFRNLVTHWWSDNNVIQEEAIKRRITLLPKYRIASFIQPWGNEFFNILDSEWKNHIESMKNIDKERTPQQALRVIERELLSITQNKEEYQDVIANFRVVERFLFPPEENKQHEGEEGQEKKK